MSDYPPQKARFSKREWWLVLILVNTIQGAIWYAAFVNAGSGSALNYVSFAGTLVSIILAVLAIGYTYAESQSQKNKSDSVAVQIGILSEVVSSIKAETASLDNISKINTELQNIKIDFEASLYKTYSKVDSISSSLTQLLDTSSRFQQVDSGPSAELPVSKSQLANAFMSYRMPLMEISLLGILLAHDKKYEINKEMIDDCLIKYVTKASINLGEKDPKRINDIEVIFTGSFFSLAYSLFGLGLVTGSPDQHILITPELARTVGETTIKSPKDCGDLYCEIRKLMLKDLDMAKMTRDTPTT